MRNARAQWSKSSCLVALGLGVLTSGTAFGSLSEKIVFTAFMDGNSESDLYMMNPDGSNLVNLSETLDGDISKTHISPDGMNILFSWRHPIDGQGMYYMSMSDGTVNLIRPLLSYEYPFGWVDNDTVFYRETGGAPSQGDIWYIELDGTNDNGPILEASCFGQGSIDQACFYPDESRFAVSAQLGSWGPSGDIYAAGPGCTDFEVIYEDPGDSPWDGHPVCMNNEPYNLYWAHGENDIYGYDGIDVFEVYHWGDTFVDARDISPDDTMLLLRRGPELATYVLDTGEVNVLVNSDSMGSARWGFVYSGEPELLFHEQPLPGIAGGPNTFRVYDCTFGEVVTVMYSLNSDGASDVPNCPGTTLSLWNAKKVGTAVADYDSVANVTVFVPGVASGMTVYFQAYEEATCFISDLMMWTFE